MNDMRVPARRWHGAAIPARWLLVFVTAWLLLDQWLLWRFLDLPTWLGLAALPLTIWLLCAIEGSSGLKVSIPLSRLLICFGVALLLLALGGEGRFFYSNIDWQVRDAVLRDMALHPWPFVYVEDGEAQLLRAPIAMFLVPALAFKAGGAAAGDIALWLQNSLLTGAVLALGSTLFYTARGRIIAIVTIILFSGLDIVGTLMFHGELHDHLEFWFATAQFSSFITQLFWVPQHGLAGWLAALLFLLWIRGLMRLWPLLAVLPLTALWSPLALIGAMPFAIWAVATTLYRRKLSPADFGWPALSVLLVLPSLVYLAAAPDGVGIRPYAIDLSTWWTFVSLEMLVYALPLLLAVRGTNAGQDRAPLLLATLWLLLCPFIQIGWSLDFMMRTSIPSLAILAFLVAQALDQSPSRRLRLWLALMLLIGSATGLSEVRRALVQPPSPRGECSIFGVWNVSFSQYPKGTYLAPLYKVPPIVRPANPVRVNVLDPRPCWTGTWLRPSGI